MSQRKDSLLHAREQAEQAELRLQQLTATLASEREKRERVAHQKGVASEEGARLDDDLQTREKDLSCLREDLDALRGKTEQALDLLKNEEMGLREKVGNSEEQLDVVRKERMAVEKEAMEMANCASDMEERARVASVALEETRRELEEVRVQLAEKVKEEEAVDRDTGGVVDRGVEEVAMRKMLGDLECELGELQRELRARDAVVNEVAVESDELRSLLASRDAEVRLLKSRLESAVVVQEERGGDSSLSDLSLQVIKRNMDAEQLALSAEIAKAELATFEISEEDLDPLDRIKKEMDVEGDFLQAGLRKAETAVELEEHSMLRREGNVDDILKQVESGQEIESGVIADETEAMTVAKVAQNKKATEKEAKPKKRRGRPPKSGGATKASNGDGEEKVKRKRGRPRKA